MLVLRGTAHFPQIVDFPLKLLPQIYERSADVSFGPADTVCVFHQLRAPIKIVDLELERHSVEAIVGAVRIFQQSHGVDNLCVLAPAQNAVREEPGVAFFDEGVAVGVATGVADL